MIPAGWPSISISCNTFGFQMCLYTTWPHFKHSVVQKNWQGYGSLTSRIYFTTRQAKQKSYKKSLLVLVKKANTAAFKWYIFLVLVQATHVTFMCPMRFNKFPLDQHRCKFMVGSSHYDESRMTFSNKKLVGSKKRRYKVN